MQPTQKQPLGVPIAIVLAGLLIATAVYFSGSKGTTPQVANEPTATDITIKAVSSTDHILGNPDAPIKIVEYSDTECPFCKQFHITLHQIISDYGTSGKVAWVYRQFPIAGLHPKAPKEAESAECVAELGGNDKFWQYLDKIYTITPSNNGLDPAELPILASQVGVDVNAFNSCLISGKYKAKVDASIAEAKVAGALGTPYSVIITKDEKIPITQGALPYADMKRIIDIVVKSL